MLPGIFHVAHSWESSNAVGLMTWEAVSQDAGYSSACFPTTPLSEELLLIGAPRRKRGFLGLRGSQAASSQADLQTGQPHTLKN